MRCKGVVYNWPRSDSVKDFIDNIDDSEYLVEERPLKRVYHKDTNIVEWKHLGIIVVTFEGNKLPDSLLVYNGLLYVRVKRFIPEVRQCFNCFGYRHFKKFCRVTKKCLICGFDFHDQCTDTVRCINCGQGHKATDKRSSVYLQHKKVNIMVAKERIKFYEARRMFNLHRLDRPYRTRIW